MHARPQSSITCEEEERTRKGFDVQVYFTVDGALRDVRKLSLKRDGQELLSMKYIPAARLYFVNHGWRHYEQDGFLVETKTGFWKKSPTAQVTPEEGAENPVTRVKLYTSDTADALYIHPTSVLDLSPAGVLTLQYALKKAVEQVFQVEPGEVSATLMGEGEQPNIMIYEAAEGSLGVLSQIVDKPERFRELVREAYRVCYFDLSAEEERQKPPASYDDLLSYYNQRHHRDLDRRLIKGALEALMACDLDAQGASGEDYDAHYERIAAATDPNSELERRFVEYLYQRGVRLPDQAQYNPNGLFVCPDFYYAPNVVVFVDGSVHDDETVRRDDHRKRRALRNDGYRVVEWYYKDDLGDVLQRHADVFTPVR